MEWAVAMGLRDDNPCTFIGPALGRQNHRQRHFPAVHHAEVGHAVAAVNASGARPVVKLAFEFLVLTAARSGEVRGARWSEMDAANRMWTIPAERMKGNREHRVPLCPRALNLLAAARVHESWRPGEPNGSLVFPGARGRLKDEALSKILRDLEIPAVPHGFRSSFRDWAAEETDHPREVAEAALAHVVRNRTEAAYARSDLFDRRRKLMDEWGGYVARPRRASPSAAALR
jgi:integrase